MSDPAASSPGGEAFAPDVPAAAAGAVFAGLPFPISRRTDPVSVRPGVRVIVRHKLPHPPAGGPSPSATDTIGVLRSIDPLVVAPTGGPARHVAHGDVIVLKTLSQAPVRNRDIRDVEMATAAAFPGISNRWFGGWLARAGDGITERSNSAVPLLPEASTTAVPVEDIAAFYRSHGLPTRLLIPDRIARPAETLPGERGPEVIVMTRDLSGDAPAEEHSPHRCSVPQATVRIDDHPDPEWLSMYHFRGQPLPEHALQLLSSRIEGHLGFGRVTVDGELAAITRGTVTHGGSRTWLGYSAVEVAPRYRRQGLGTLLGNAMLRWGADLGADGAYLHVVETNTPGRALYHGLGFHEHHRHRCIVLGNPDSDATAVAR